MAYVAYIDGGLQIPLATTSGWAEARSWLESLDLDRYFYPVHYAEHAYTIDLDDFMSQLAAALDDPSCPPSPYVREVFTDLLDGMREKPAGAKWMTVWDGMGPDDGSPADGDEEGESDQPPTPETQSVTTTAHLTGNGNNQYVHEHPTKIAEQHVSDMLDHLTGKLQPHGVTREHLIAALASVANRSKSAGNGKQHIRNAIRSVEFNFENGSPASIAKIRLAVGDKLSREEFDRHLSEMATSRAIHIHRLDSPHSVSESERNDLFRDNRGRYYNVASIGDRLKYHAAHLANTEEHSAFLTNVIAEAIFLAGNGNNQFERLHPDRPAQRESAAQVLERIKRSPNQPASKDWDGYAKRWGVQGNFQHHQIPLDQLVTLNHNGQLYCSAHTNDQDVRQKAESGQLNPVIITRSNDPSRGPLVVVDGTHSLHAAHLRKDSHVHAIVSDEAANHIDLPVSDNGSRGPRLPVSFRNSRKQKQAK